MTVSDLHTADQMWLEVNRRREAERQQQHAREEEQKSEDIESVLEKFGEI